MDPASDRRARAFDVVLLGATGFTGRLVAEALAERCADGSARVALAGRDETRLAAVRDDLAGRQAGPAWPLRVVDSHDRPALDALAAETRVLCTTVGPYARHGADAVAACAEAGTSYCDLTAETPFIRAVLRDHHERARATGARLVHACGFDSIPSDLGTYLLQRSMASDHGGRLTEVALRVTELRGSFSGGTSASLLGLAELARRDPDARAMLADPYGLNPDGERHGPDGPDPLGVRRDPASGHWTAPFIMAGINTRIVRRTNALLDYAYGRDFRYGEAMDTGPGLAGLARATLLSAGTAAFLGLAAFAPGRALLRRLLPEPGDGPDAERRARGRFVMELVGRGVDADGRTVELRGRVSGQRDPGYAETARMLAESALCLALDADRLPGEGGCLTPAAAMGDALLERLRAVGLEFRVEPGRMAEAP